MTHLPARILLFTSGLLIGGLFIGLGVSRQGHQTSLGVVDVYFSPRGGCTEAIIREINKAKSTILVQAYSFTSKPITDALIRAHERGVKVEAVIDGDQFTAQYSDADDLYSGGSGVWGDHKHAISHNKVMVIDGQIVVTGSFNFTKSAEEANAENLLVLHSPELARKYADNFYVHKGHSKPFTQEKHEPVKSRKR